jgi:trimeric autotransporter adhesin
MSSTKQTQRVAGAFAVLATLALAISCRGFFVNPTLTSIAISPTAPQVEQGQTLQLQAFGTYDDGSRSQIRSGVSWSSSSSSVASVDSNTGILTGVSPGTSSISASSQALSSTATATVFLVINSIAISPTSASVTAGTSQNFTVTAASNGSTLDLTSSATLTPEQNGAAVSTITCSYNGSIPAQVCTTSSGTTVKGIYQIVASYSGSTLTATATLIVN